MLDALSETRNPSGDSAPVKILSAVFNPIAYDGRVQRACEALAKIADVELLCPSGPDVPDGLPFKVKTVLLPAARMRRHVHFAYALVKRARRVLPDLVHAHDFFMAGPGAAAATASGARLIYDAHELIIPEPDRPMSLRSQFWYRLEQWSVKRADLVIAANAERAALMQEHYRLGVTPLVVRNIPPAPPADVEAESAAFGRRPGERLCVYQGDVSLARGLETFLLAVGELPPGVRLLIVGGGVGEPAVRQTVVRLGLQDRVTMLGPVPRRRLPGILRACDIGLLTYPSTGLNNVYCAPNKIFEYAQAGLPVITTAQPPLKKMLAQYRIGESFSADEHPSAIASKVLSVLENRDAYRTDLRRFLSENTWTAEAERLRGAVLGMLASGSSLAPDVR